MKLFCNNKCPIGIAHSLVQNDKMKYIEVDRSFIKESSDIGWFVPRTS